MSDSIGGVPRRSRPTAGRSLLIAGVGAAAALTTSPAIAPAATVTKLARGIPMSASRDGRYVLVQRDVSGGAVLDRQGPELPGASTDTTTGGFVASGSPTSIGGVSGGTGVINPLAAGGPATTVFPETNIFDGIALAKNGHVAFSVTQTDGAPTSIVERDLDTGSVKTRVTGIDFPQLLSASEDGRVITFLSQLPTGGHAVSYQVDGQAPRVVDRFTVSATWVSTTPACADRLRAFRSSEPQDLQVVEDGDAARYAFVIKRQLGTFTRPGDDPPVTSYETVRLRADGSAEQIGTASASTYADVIALDRYSSAYLATGPLGTGGIMHADDGSTWTLPQAPDQYTNGPIAARGAVAFQSGRVQGDTGEDLVAYVIDGPQVGATQSGVFTTLPRAGDPELTPSTAATYAIPACPGVIADYATITPKSSGNSAGTVTYTPQPDAKLAAKSLKVTVSWFGIPIWVRSAGSATTVNLPAIVPGLSGFVATARVTLADSSVLSTSAALRRTR